MKFFYADSLDLVDPDFDFVADKSTNATRVPQRDDIYAHELYDEAPYDGLLVSRGLFMESRGSSLSGKYTIPQRMRFERLGVRRFLRLPTGPVLGDCGAFSYKNDDEPPFSVINQAQWYAECGFTHGVSLDHIVMAYNIALDSASPAQGALPGFDSEHDTVRRESVRRQQLSLNNAEEFLSEVRKLGSPFVPLGAAHGWSPASYRSSVRKLMTMGYDYIALGGLVPVKTNDIRTVLREVRLETGGRIKLHLLGISRQVLHDEMRDAGVASFDSSSPLLQAFKDARSNYYATGGHYTAVRIPQSDQGVVLRRIKKGEIAQADAVAAETKALAAVREWGRSERGLDEVMGTLEHYGALVGSRKAKIPWSRVRRTLAERPWESCGCSVCKSLGVEVVIFRGANRNRRRGFHNLWWTHRELKKWLSGGGSE